MFGPRGCAAGGRVISARAMSDQRFTVVILAAQRDGSVTRLVQGVKAGGTVALRSFADMDVAPLPGFAAPNSFRF